MFVLRSLVSSFGWSGPNPVHILQNVSNILLMFWHELFKTQVGVQEWRKDQGEVAPVKPPTINALDMCGTPVKDRSRSGSVLCTRVESKDLLATRMG